MLLANTAINANKHYSYFIFENKEGIRPRRRGHSTGFWHLFLAFLHGLIQILRISLNKGVAY